MTKPQLPSIDHGVKSPDHGGQFIYAAPAVIVQPINRLVLSATGGPGEIVVALWLLRSHPPLDERIRISPLFEDEQALAGCGETLRAVLALPEYIAHLGCHELTQEVTIGYSDTTKATGYLRIGAKA